MPNRTAAEVPIKGTKHTVIPDMAPHCYSKHLHDLKITDCQRMKRAWSLSHANLASAWRRNKRAVIAWWAKNRAGIYICLLISISTPSTPSSSLQLPSYPLTIPLPTLYLKKKEKNPLCPISVAHTCKGVGPPSGSWDTSQWSHPQKKKGSSSPTSHQLLIAPQ